jgi:hypothetical protein
VSLTGQKMIGWKVAFVVIAYRAYSGQIVGDTDAGGYLTEWECSIQGGWSQGGWRRSVMQSRFLWPAIVCVGLVLLALVWMLNDREGLDQTAGWAVTLGVLGTLAVGIGLMAIIFQGRRSRRDRLVDRKQHHERR